LESKKEKHIQNEENEEEEKVKIESGFTGKA